MIYIFKITFSNLFEIMYIMYITLNLIRRNLIFVDSFLQELCIFFLISRVIRDFCDKLKEMLDLKLNNFC